MKLETPSTGERSAKQTRASAKSGRKPASRAAQPNRLEAKLTEGHLTDSVRDGQPPLPPIPDFPEWLPLEGEGTVYPWSAITGPVEVTADPLDFTPVPRLRNRRGGWTPEVQRQFIESLAECGCVSQAARAVGLSPRGAYRLLYAEGADSFAAAWDQAIARGVERLRADAFERAFSGTWVPVYRKGRLVRVEHRRLDRLAIALLSGRKACVAQQRELGTSRRRHRSFLADKRREAEEEKASAADYAAELERMIEIGRRPRPPRIRRL